jgi:hypothetical protein
MNTNPIQSNINQGKLKAWELRQKDTGWGRVIAQSWVPFYGLYYALSRRTITPWLWSCLISTSAAVSVGLINIQKSSQELDQMGQLTALITAPLGIKIGTNNARNYAKKRLEEE